MTVPFHEWLLQLPVILDRLRDLDAPTPRNEWIVSLQSEAKDRALEAAYMERILNDRVENERRTVYADWQKTRKTRLDIEDALARIRAEHSARRQCGG